MLSCEHFKLPTTKRTIDSLTSDVVVLYSGTWAFPAIIDAFPEGPRQTSGPFWIGSGLAFLSALIVLVLVPEVKSEHFNPSYEHTSISDTLLVL